MSTDSTFATRRFAVDKQRLLGQLREVLPARNLLVDEEDLRPYECDGLMAYRQLPLIVVLPENEAQAQDVLKIAMR